jgi:hypothetical protein
MITNEIRSAEEPLCALITNESIVPGNPAMRYYELKVRLLPAPPQEWIFELRESTGVPEPHESNAQYYWGNI